MTGRRDDRMNPPGSTSCHSVIQSRSSSRPRYTDAQTMKVAFIKPPVGGILGLEMLTFVEPLGPICVAACLEVEGHTCAVFDLRIEGEEQGLESCRKFRPDIVGLQCNFTTERNRTIRLARKIKNE